MRGGCTTFYLRADLQYPERIIKGVSFRVVLRSPRTLLGLFIVKSICRGYWSCMDSVHSKSSVAFISPGKLEYAKKRTLVLPNLHIANR